MVKRKIVVILAVAALALAAASAASAHLQYVSGNYVQGPICVGGSVGFAEGPAANGAQMFVDVWSQSFGAGVCLTAKNMPAGQLILRRELWRWNGVEWRLCATNGWLYNSSPTSYRYINAAWSPVPCGTNSYYGVYGYGYAWWEGQWLGGHRWPGYHLI